MSVEKETSDLEKKLLGEDIKPSVTKKKKPKVDDIDNSLKAEKELEQKFLKELEEEGVAELDEEDYLQIIQQLESDSIVYEKLFEESEKKLKDSEKKKADWKKYGEEQKALKSKVEREYRKYIDELADIIKQLKEEIEGLQGSQQFSDVEFERRESEQNKEIIRLEASRAEAVTASNKNLASARQLNKDKKRFAKAYEVASNNVNVLERERQETSRETSRLKKTNEELKKENEELKKENEVNNRIIEEEGLLELKPNPPSPFSDDEDELSVFEEESDEEIELEIFRDETSEEESSSEEDEDEAEFARIQAEEKKKREKKKAVVPPIKGFDKAISRNEKTGEEYDITYDSDEGMILTARKRKVPAPPGLQSARDRVPKIDLSKFINFADYADENPEDDRLKILAEEQRKQIKAKEEKAKQKKATDQAFKELNKPKKKN